MVRPDVDWKNRLANGILQVSFDFGRQFEGGVQTRGIKDRNQAYDLMNGILGGLISSSPTSACTQPWEAIIIGAIGSLIACWTNERLFKQRMQIDDPVGAVGTHAGAGM